MTDILPRKINHEVTKNAKFFLRYFFAFFVFSWLILILSGRRSSRPGFQFMNNDTELTVFENENENDNNNGAGAEKDRSRGLLVVGAIAALMLTILIIALAVTKSAGDREVENMARAGSPEFDAYKDKVTVDVDPEGKMVYPNMIGMWQLEARATLTNRGDRELTGVEVVGKMLDFEDKVIAQAVKRPIPRIRKDPLKPGESMNIVLKVDAPKNITEDAVKDITIELHGVRFQ